MNRQFAGFIVQLTIMVLLFSFGLSASEVSWRFERLWPTLAQPWYFRGPAGLACDASGNVYIADSRNGRVQKYTSQGQFITMWDGTADGGEAFDSPWAITVDMDGNVYVLDSQACRVRVFNPLGLELASWGGPGETQGHFDLPSGIALDHAGQVYVADTNNHRIQYFTASGEWQGEWPGNKAKTLAFREPRDLAFSADGLMYVADTGNDRIVVVDEQGAKLWAWGNTGSAPGKFDRPLRVLIDNAGLVYVSDANNHRIQKFDAQGFYQSHWGREGHDPGEFSLVDGLAMNAFGHILAADRQLHDRIHVFTNTGAFIALWGSQWGGRNEFNGPQDMVVDDDGTIYVADYGNSRIQRLNKAGRFLSFWGPAEGEDGYCRKPYSLALDGMRNLAYAYDLYDRRIRQFDMEGSFISDWDGNLGSGFRTYYAGLAAAHGRLYMADSVNHRVRVFCETGSVVDDWGRRGANDGQLMFPYGVVVDADGLVYVADTYNNRIQVFGEGGAFVRGWGEEGDGPGEFSMPKALAVAQDGTLLVSDSHNNRIQQFTPMGDFITAFGAYGAAPGYFNAPDGLAVLQDNRILVADRLNNRLQQFHAIEQATRPKAIIVAGGGPIPGNALWDATRLCAHFAYHTLLYAGYGKEDISLLSADRHVDLDNNGQADNVADACTLEALEYALTGWIEKADLLLVYLVNHGGENTFRMNADEILDASVFAQWLSTARDKVSGPLIVINDSCHSGSFIDVLASEDLEPAPVVIASTAPDQSAYFLGTGTVSFSSIFWMEILNGHDVGNAYRFASDTIQDIYNRLQTPRLDGTGDGNANQPADFEAASGIYLGMGDSTTERPVVNHVIVPEHLSGAETVEIIAEDVTSQDALAQVWAVVRPPGIGEADGGPPIISLPTVSLDPSDAHRYRGVYRDLSTAGEYRITVYARDVAGRTSRPVMRSVFVDDTLRSRAVVVAAATTQSPFWEAATRQALLARRTLRFQGYADEDIRFYCAETIDPGVTGLPTVDNLRDAVTRWAATETRDLVLYITGVGAFEMVELGPGELLFAPTLKSWLDDLQATLPGRVVVICDFCASGSFLRALAGMSDGRRIVVSGGGVDSAPAFSDGGEASFSRFFWRQILAGANLRSAFLHASNALRFGDAANMPCLDDTGDGLYVAGTDGRVAAVTTLGRGIQMAADAPVISEVSPAQVIGATSKKSAAPNSAEIWANPITSTATLNRVFATVFPPDHDPRDCGAEYPGGYVIVMTPDETGRYRIVYDGFVERGDYHILVYAEDVYGEISPPAPTVVMQRGTKVTPDDYEPDDTPETAVWIGINGEEQRRNFSHEHDEDWALFYAEANQLVVVETRNLGPRADTRIELYRQEDYDTIIAWDEYSNPDHERGALIQWRADEAGFYLVRVANIPPEEYGADAFYTLRVQDDTGVAIPGSIAITVLDAKTDNGISDVTVSLRGFGGLSSQTTGTGAALFPALPANPYTVVAKKTGYQQASLSVTVRSGEMASETLALHPVGTDDNGAGEGEGEGNAGGEGEEGDGEGNDDPGEDNVEGEEHDADRTLSPRGCACPPCDAKGLNTVDFLGDWLVLGLSLVLLYVSSRRRRSG